MVHLPSLDCLQAHIEAADFKGYDPYDALNSPVLRALSFRQKFVRIAFIQLLKRLPVNLRTLLLVKKDYNPKGLGLLLWGYAKLYAREKYPRYLERIDRLLDLLEGLKSPGCSGNGWGYNFDWQSRAFFVPKYTPTVVNSSFIGHALLDAWQMTGNERALEMALPIGDFILRDLNRHEEDGTVCFSYTPLDRYFVHNANLMAASLLIRLFKETEIAVNTIGTGVEADLGGEVNSYSLLVNRGEKKGPRGDSRITNQQITNNSAKRMAREVFSGEDYVVVEGKIRVRFGPYEAKAFLFRVDEG